MLLANSHDKIIALSMEDNQLPTFSFYAIINPKKKHTIRNSINPGALLNYI